MSAFEVLEKYGRRALLRFVAAMVAFVLLDLARQPFLLVARVLEVCMRRVDAAVVAGLPPGPIPMREAGP
jgi:hypothetical protein